MAKSVRAKVKPEVLTWARKSAGFTEELAAKKLTVKVERVLAWENPDHDLTPTLNQLRKMAQVYKRPLAVFYLQEVPRGFQVMHDFRRISEAGDREYSPELTLEIRSIQQRRELALELFEEIGEIPKRFEFVASTNEAPEVVGRKIRDLLGVDRDLQTRWIDSRIAFNAWREKIEELGILVFQMTSVSTREVSGIAFHEALLPAIAINKKDAFNRRIFSMLHEVTHLLIGMPGISEHDVDAPRAPDDQRVEVFCNRVAAAALMPQNWFLSEPIVQRPHESESWTDEEISELADVFNVSRDAIVRRLLTFGLTTARFYKAKHDQYREEYLERKENERIRIKESGREFRRNPPRDAVSAMGKPFVRAVLTNYHQERLTLSDVSRYLGLRVKHVPTIEHFVGFG